MEEKKLIIASIPRTGSTWLFRSIAGLKHRSRAPKNNFYDVHGVKVPRVTVSGWNIIKTHLPYDWWKDYLTDKDKVIFLFGDIIESVISTYLKRYMYSHFKNCGYFGGMRDIFREDFLGYEHLFDSWVNIDIDKLLVDYDSINFEKIREYVPFDFIFNEFKHRQKSNREKVNKAWVYQAEHTYKRLAEKIKEYRNEFTDRN